MQFSIRRPKLPSSETHPEESLFRRLDVSAWLGHLNELGQVEEEYKLRQVWSRGLPRAHSGSAVVKQLPRGDPRVWGAPVGPVTPGLVPDVRTALLSSACRPGGL